MKFSLVVVTLFTFFTVSLAVPVVSYDATDDLVSRAIRDLDVLSAREWIDLYARSGPGFAKTDKKTKQNAHTFIDQAKHGGQLGLAASPGNSAKTYHQDGTFHLDRQQPTNIHGQHKVAVQLNKVNKGKSSTMGQVIIHKDAHPSDKTVAAKLKHSVNTGKEHSILYPSKKQQNIAKNQAAHKAKQERIAKKAAGKARGI